MISFKIDIFESTLLKEIDKSFNSLISIVALKTRN